MSPQSRAVERSLLSAAQYERIRQRIFSVAGIELGSNRQAMVESRLLKRLVATGESDFSSYLRRIERDPAELTCFVNALTTNKTEWFRENRHFEYLSHHVIPAFSTRNGRNVRPFFAWSAACSTGEEVYSLAMLLRERLRPEEQFRILGTDIDTEVLQAAREGRYKAQDARARVPLEMQKYLIDVIEPGKPGRRVEIVQELRRLVKFRKYNLVEDELPSDIRFDVVFLRNVLIYFSRSTIQKVTERIRARLRPGGLLFIGHSESLSGISGTFEPVSESVYRVKD